MRAFVDRRIVESCVDVNEIERPYKSGKRYVAFVDPSGGSSDSMTLGIGHRDKDSILVDVVREVVAPFDPESATEEFSNVLKSYQLATVTGDRYAASGRGKHSASAGFNTSRASNLKTPSTRTCYRN